MLVKALIAGVFALCVFTGCGGGPAVAPVTFPIAFCTSALIAGNLISPAAGATGVSTAVGSISFSVADGRMLAGSSRPDRSGVPLANGVECREAAVDVGDVVVVREREAYRDAAGFRCERAHQARRVVVA
jgi:hypothetical protein